jgi:hypothetical protein
MFDLSNLVQAYFIEFSSLSCLTGILEKKGAV